jgi:1,4-alpha-glucan branching enzyme
MIKKKETVDVTFIFDEETEEQVYLVGDFNNWNQDITPLKKTNNRWQATINLQPGAYAYKYFRNNEWLNDREADAYIPNKFGQTDSVVLV